MYSVDVGPAYGGGDNRIGMHPQRARNPFPVFADLDAVQMAPSKDTALFACGGGIFRYEEMQNFARVHKERADICVEYAYNAALERAKAKMTSGNGGSSSSIAQTGGSGSPQQAYGQVLIEYQRVLDEICDWGYTMQRNCARSALKAHGPILQEMYVQAVKLFLDRAFKKSASHRNALGRRRASGIPPFTAYLHSFYCHLLKTPEVRHAKYHSLGPVDRSTLVAECIRATLFDMLQPHVNVEITPMSQESRHRNPTSSSKNSKQPPSRHCSERQISAASLSDEDDGQEGDDEAGDESQPPRHPVSEFFAQGGSGARRPNRAAANTIGEKGTQALRENGAGQHKRNTETFTGSLTDLSVSRIESLSEIATRMPGGRISSSRVTARPSPFAGDETPAGGNDALAASREGSRPAVDKAPTTPRTPLTATSSHRASEGPGRGSTAESDRPNVDEKPLEQDHGSTRHQIQQFMPQGEPSVGPLDTTTAPGVAEGQQMRVSAAQTGAAWQANATNQERQTQPIVAFANPLGGSAQLPSKGPQTSAFAQQMSRSRQSEDNDNVPTQPALVSSANASRYQQPTSAAPARSSFNGAAQQPVAYSPHVPQVRPHNTSVSPHQQQQQQQHHTQQNQNQTPMRVSSSASGVAHQPVGASHSSSLRTSQHHNFPPSNPMPATPAMSNPQQQHQHPQRTSSSQPSQSRLGGTVVDPRQEQQQDKRSDESICIAIAAAKGMANRAS